MANLALTRHVHFSDGIYRDRKMDLGSFSPDAIANEPPIPRILEQIDRRVDRPDDPPIQRVAAQRTLRRLGYRRATSSEIPPREFVLGQQLVNPRLQQALSRS
jgi:hypothetical protein